ncbi:PREDICTED: tripartite motif-containing protein 3-like isoform X2 [Branchiostoma belcheri]|uniref:Tripartite motif-containing protein 3-like isoform X2 n=2 Tax=Branchiostoma belcheri TaxID=7741 RepID=A0A6P4Y9F2_BRABE|nr:PREDICTED: tripartite motif-containing protein 3-like isoform X2 [Branchiostoma belcheri]
MAAAVGERSRKASSESGNEMLTCGICLDTYTRPKLLPCAHSFCEDCLHGMVGWRISMSCPNCRKDVKLPDTGVRGLPENFWVSNLRQVLSERRELEVRELGMRREGRECTIHEGEQLRYFCTRCDVTVCSECMIQGHKNHDVTRVADVLEQQRAKVKVQLERGRERAQVLTGRLRDMAETETELDARQERAKRSIQEATDQLIDAIAKEKVALLQDLDTSHLAARHVIADVRTQVEQDLGDLLLTLNRAETAAAADDPSDVIDSKHKLSALKTDAVYSCPLPDFSFTASKVLKAKIKVGQLSVIKDVPPTNNNSSNNNQPNNQQQDSRVRRFRAATLRLVKRPVFWVVALSFLVLLCAVLFSPVSLIDYLQYEHEELEGASTFSTYSQYWEEQNS